MRLLSLNSKIMTQADNGNVELTINEAGAATITFFHPAQNSMPSALLADLAEHIERAGKDERTKVIILKSGGDRTFCAGASFDELLQIKTAEQGAEFFSGFARVINACRKSPKIIIARVQGKAVGGGVGLAAAADYCLATEFASVKLSELTIGIGPFVIAPAVIRKIGLSAFTELTLRAADFQPARWAAQKGLYNELYPGAPELDAAVEALAGQLAAYNPEALRNLKATLWEGTENWDDLLYQRARISGELVISDSTQQALSKFLNGKRDQK
jgi:methylglutaconyl-CoA hydratase